MTHAATGFQSYQGTIAALAFGGVSVLEWMSAAVIATVVGIRVSLGAGGTYTTFIFLSFLFIFIF